MQVFLEGAGFDGNEVDKRSLVSQSKCCESGIRDQRARAAARRSPRRCSLQSASDGGGRLGQSEGVGCRYRRVSRLAVTAARQMEMAGGLARHRDTKHPPKGLGLGRLHARSLARSGLPHLHSVALHLLFLSPFFSILSSSSVRHLCIFHSSRHDSSLISISANIHMLPCRPWLFSRQSHQKPFLQMPCRSLVLSHRRLWYS